MDIRLAVAVGIDATVTRWALTPADSALLGNRTSYLPRRLSRLTNDASRANPLRLPCTRRR